MKAYYDNRPSRLEAVGNGSYLYRWNITEESVEHEEGTMIQYSCEEVVVWSPITSNKITEKVIGEIWEQSYELKLINEYNSAILGVYEQNETLEKIDMYKSFLDERNKIKKEIDLVCIQFGIR